MTWTRQERFSVLKFQLGAPGFGGAPTTLRRHRQRKVQPGNNKLYHDFVILSIPLLLRFARIR
jgi:hypothetical protein